MDIIIIVSTVLDSRGAMEKLLEIEHTYKNLNEGCLHD